MAERDSFASTALADITDRSIHAAVGRYTAGLSPMAIGGAYLDWLSHLAFSPGKQQLLVQKAVRKAVRLASYAARANDGAAPCIEPLPQDHRFDDPAWKAWPFNVIHQAFLLEQQLWHNAMTGVRGVSARNERVVEFGTRQWLDMFSPSNFPLTNPVLMERTVREAGLNFAQGAQNFLADWERAVAGAKPVGTEAFRPGREVAATPGRVVLRNRLMELIQYQPATPRVHPEPVLIVPAWIMKYYILDLSERDSLVRHLIARGHTVFMISWMNPGPEDRDLALDDYRKLGVMAALDAIAGERAPMTDLMAWNADATRMPYRMHSEYLRHLFLMNELAGGRFAVEGKPVLLNDVRVPFFVVSTERDHVAPWRSVFKIHALTDAEVTFVLASGGHNAGIVSPPGRDGRHYRAGVRAAGERYVDADTWNAAARPHQGSWWGEWDRWLARHSGAGVKPPPLGAARRGLPALGPAPGT